jgi:hypothetical protein
MSETPETGIEESDPNADSPEGLAGELGVSSERTGPVRGGADEVTYGTAATHTEEDAEGEPPPEQSAYDGEPEVHPDNDVPAHPRNRGTRGTRGAEAAYFGGIRIPPSTRMVSAFM